MSKPKWTTPYPDEEIAAEADREFAAGERLSDEVLANWEDSQPA
jgi:hypothetical protein